MDDLISRQAAIDALMPIYKSASLRNRNVFSTARKCMATIEDLPSAQPDITACGDCKHYIPHDKRCGYWNHGTKPLDWCSHAERRADE